MLVEGEGDVYRCGHEHAATRTAALAAEYLVRRGSSAPSSRGRAVVEIHDFARKSQLNQTVTWLAGGPGFEPGLLGPEPRVLPLNYPPTTTDEA